MNVGAASATSTSGSRLRRNPSAALLERSGPELREPINALLQPDVPGLLHILLGVRPEGGQRLGVLKSGNRSHFLGDNRGYRFVVGDLEYRNEIPLAAHRKDLRHSL